MSNQGYYGGGPPQQGGYYPPPPQQGYGGPPPQGYGGPQQGYGGPPQGYGGPPQGGYPQQYPNQNMTMAEQRQQKVKGTDAADHAVPVSSDAAPAAVSRTSCAPSASSVSSKERRLYGGRGVDSIASVDTQSPT
ncbi:unnamed protein product [Jaminaea pallidilutea]